jgi:hypothetical protein
MLYPWPVVDIDGVLDGALRIVMCYLQMKRVAEDYATVEKVAATIIFNEWRKGVRRPIRLANSAIVSIEGKGSVDLRPVAPQRKK